MIDRDPFELLRRMNPIRHARLEAGDDALLERIVTSAVPAPTPIAPPASHPSRRIRTIVLVGGLSAVVLATAAFTFLRTGNADNPTQIDCHRTADLQSDRDVRPNIGDPVAACNAPWTNGLFGTNGPPELHACVGSDNTIEVFPGDLDVCARLGLTRQDTASNASAAQLDQLSTRLAADFRNACVGQNDALADTNQVISDVGLTGWTVKLEQPYSTSRPCTAFIIDPAAKVVTIGGRLDITS